MARIYKRYTEEFKRDALAMAAKGDMSDVQLERDPSITAKIIASGDK